MYKSNVNVTSPEAPGKTYRYDFNDNYIYVGKAPVGTLDNEIGWTISRVTLVNGEPVNKLVASNAVWDNRVTESYEWYFNRWTNRSFRYGY